MALRPSPNADRAPLFAAFAALRAGDLDAARAAVEAACGAAPDAELPARLRDHLARRHRGEVYAEPAAFRAFIRGGGNPGLYAATGAALAAAWRAAAAEEVLDIGCGDGLAVEAALDRAERPPAQLTLVEPQPALLAAAAAMARPRVGGVAALCTDLRGFLADGPARTWPMAQATFALQALAPEPRAALLAALRARVARLAVVEFDVPPWPDRSDAHLRYLLERYPRGLAEYRGDGGLVADGFLLPVLVGQLLPSGRGGVERATWEQPAAAWRRDLQAAGFAAVRARRLWRYWWADAWLIEAHS